MSKLNCRNARNSINICSTISEQNHSIDTVNKGNDSELKTFLQFLRHLRLPLPTQKHSYLLAEPRIASTQVKLVFIFQSASAFWIFFRYQRWDPWRFSFRYSYQSFIYFSWFFLVLVSRLKYTLDLGLLYRCCSLRRQSIPYLRIAQAQLETFSWSYPFKFALRPIFTRPGFFLAFSSADSILNPLNPLTLLLWLRWSVVSLEFLFLI